MHRLFNRKGYIFTDKKNPKWGVMSFILGMVSAVSIGLAVYFTYRNSGVAPMQYGAVILLAILYAVTGMVLGIRSMLEKDIFRFFPVLGILLNLAAAAAGGFILYLGVF